jgi:hypothetical protein
VFVLNKLSTEDLIRVLTRALHIVYDDPEQGAVKAEAQSETSPSTSQLVPPSSSSTADPPHPDPSAAAADTQPAAATVTPATLTKTSSGAAPSTTATSSPPDPIFQQTGPLDPPLLRFLAAAADGDARVALSSLELALAAIKAVPPGQPIDREELKRSLRKAHLQYDRNGENHYDTISALHKAVRGSDANAALYWLARMLEGGEDPLYVARRCVRMVRNPSFPVLSLPLPLLSFQLPWPDVPPHFLSFPFFPTFFSQQSPVLAPSCTDSKLHTQASEDVGLANPQALPQALSAYQATQLIGMPECDVRSPLPLLPFCHVDQLVP